MYILSHYNTNLYLLACITCAFKFVFSGIFARALTLCSSTFRISCGKTFFLFSFSRFAVFFLFFFHSWNCQPEFSFFLCRLLFCAACEKWLHIQIQKRFSPKIIMNKIYAKVGIHTERERSNNLRNKIYFVVWWIILSPFFSDSTQTGFAFKKNHSIWLAFDNFSSACIFSYTLMLKCRSISSLFFFFGSW